MYSNNVSMLILTFKHLVHMLLHIPSEVTTPYYVFLLSLSLAIFFKNIFANVSVTIQLPLSGQMTNKHNAATIYTHTMNCMLLESWHIGMESCSLNREKGSLAQHYHSLPH